MRALRWLRVVLLVVGLPLSVAVVAADPTHGDTDAPGDVDSFPGEPREPGPPGAAPESSPRARGTRVEVLAHADPGGGFNADVVAHRGFAYLGSWGNIGVRANPATWNVFCPSQGVRVFDVRDPTTPTLVATFAHGTEAGTPSLAGTWTEKVIVRRVHTPWFRGDLAAVSVQNCRRIPMSGALDRAVFRGFGLYDVTDPANPKRLGFYAAESATQGSHELWLEVSGHRAYVYTAIILSELTTSPALGVPGRPDFRIVDVSDPIHPSEVGAWGAWAELGIAPALMDENGVVRTNFVHSVIGDGERAYLSYWDLGTVILDVAVPETPRFLSRTAFAGPEEGNAHSSWLGKGGRLLIQTDEDVIPSPDPVLETRWGYARFFDIADPTNPVPLATLTLPSTGQFPPPVGYFTVHDPKVRGNLAYLSWYAEGVVIVDISRPANPRLVAQFVPPPAPDRRGFFFPGHAFPHVWGVFVERNFVLAADVNSGLWVFRLK